MNISRILQKRRLGLFLCLSLGVFSVQGQSIVESDKIQHSESTLGLVARLAGQKAQLEALATVLLSYKTLPDNVKQDFAIDYTESQKWSDGLLLQLGADLRAANGLRKYKQLNTAVSNPSQADQQLTGQVKTYWDNFQQLNKFETNVYTTYLTKLQKQQAMDAAAHAPLKADFIGGVEPITAAIAAVATIIEDARAAREAKVGYIVATLNSLRLKPISELSKKEEMETPDKPLTAIQDAIHDQKLADEIPSKASRGQGSLNKVNKLGRIADKN
jgi:hypothetical protein